MRLSGKLTSVERGIARGYGGIWHEIEYPEDYKAKKAAEPKKVYKYAAVFDYDVEGQNFLVAERRREEKIFPHQRRHTL